jgi:hypothetical protein
MTENPNIDGARDLATANSYQSEIAVRPGSFCARPLEIEVGGEVSVLPLEGVALRRHQ